jgi:hypothetical protein
MLWFPLLIIFTPSPTMSVQSILFALMAPIRYGDTSEKAQTSPRQDSSNGNKEVDAEKSDPRRSNVAGGDTVRDCAVIEYVPPRSPSSPSSKYIQLSLYSLPPVLCDPAVAKAHYEKLEKEVEEGVKQSQTREKAFPPKPSETTQTPTA